MMERQPRQKLCFSSQDGAGQVTGSSSRLKQMGHSTSIGYSGSVVESGETTTGPMEAALPDSVGIASVAWPDKRRRPTAFLHLGG